MRQGFDIDLRAANRVRRKRERYMYYFQDNRWSVLGRQLRQSKEFVKRVTLRARPSSLVRGNRPGKAPSYARFQYRLRHHPCCTLHVDQKIATIIDWAR